MTIKDMAWLWRNRHVSTWDLKQRLAQPGRYYGNGGTIHHSGFLSVETHQGTVVAVWFRCQLLPFQQVEVDAARTTSMLVLNAEPSIDITGVEIQERKRP